MIRYGVRYGAGMGRGRGNLMAEWVLVIEALVRVRCLKVPRNGPLPAKPRPCSPLLLLTFTDLTVPYAYPRKP